MNKPSLTFDRYIFDIREAAALLVGPDVELETIEIRIEGSELWVEAEHRGPLAAAAPRAPESKKEEPKTKPAPEPEQKAETPPEQEQAAAPEEKPADKPAPDAQGEKAEPGPLGMKARELLGADSFWAFLDVNTKQNAIRALQSKVGVKSATEIDGNPDAEAKFKLLVDEYDQWRFGKAS